MRKILIVVVAVMTIGAAQALAGPLTITPTSEKMATPITNDIFNKGPYGQQFGYLGADLELTADAGTTWQVTYTYLGKEAGYTNFFGDLANELRFQTGVTPIGTQFTQTIVAAAGPVYLDFRFRANGATGFAVINGQTNAWPDVNPNFFLAIVGDPFETTGTSAYIALDDQGNGVSQDDDNHDDLVVRVDVRQVPDGGATLVLLGGALLGISALRRKLRR